MKRNQKIKKLLRSTYREPPDEADPAGMDERILSDASSSMKQAMPANPKPYRTLLWRTIMTSKITKLSSAALIVIAVMAGIIHLGGSFDRSSIVFAEVLKSIQEANSAVWHEQRVITCNGEEIPFLNSDTKRYYSLEYGAMEAMYNMEEILLHQVYWLPKKDMRIEVIPLLKQYKSTEFTEAERAVAGRSVEAIVELVKSERAVKLGCKTINGRETDGYEVKNSQIAGALVPIEHENLVARFWIDIETSLPVRYEAELISTDQLLTFLTGGKAVEIKVVGDQFEWDVNLEPDIFKPNIPPDYTQMEF